MAETDEMDPEIAALLREAQARANPAKAATSSYTATPAEGVRDVDPAAPPLHPLTGHSYQPPREKEVHPDYGADVAATVGAGQGLTGGFSAKGGALVDTFLSKAPPGLRDALEKMNAANGGHPGLSPLTDDKTFSERLGEYNQRNTDLHATHPGAMLGGQLGGGLVLGAGAPGAVPTSMGGAITRGAAGGALAGAGYSKGDPTTKEGLLNTGIDAAVGAGVGGAISAGGHAIGSAAKGAPERIDNRNIATISEDTKKRFADAIYDNTDNVKSVLRKDAELAKVIGNPKDVLPIVERRLNDTDAVSDKIYAHAYADSVGPSKTPVAAGIVAKAEAAEQRAAAAKAELADLPSGAPLRDKLSADIATATGEAGRLRREAAAAITASRQIRGVPVDKTLGVMKDLEKEYTASSRTAEAAAIRKEIDAFQGGLGADPSKPPNPLKLREYITRLQTRATTADPQAETPLSKQALRDVAGKLRGVLEDYVDEHAPGMLPTLQANNKRISAYRMIEDSALEQARRDTEPAGPFRALGNVVQAAVTHHGTTGKLGTAGAVIGGLHGAMSGEGAGMGALTGGAIGGTIGAVGHATAPIVDKALASKFGQFTLFGAGRVAPKAIPQLLIDQAAQGNDAGLRQHLQSAIFDDDKPGAAP